MGKLSIFDLPPELRERVYLASFVNRDEDARPEQRRPCEAAITRTSRLVREEALPLYYQRFPLTVQTYVKSDSFGHVWLTTNRWYRRLSPIKISWLSVLRLRFGFLERFFGEPVTVDFVVALDRRIGSYSISHSFDSGWISDAPQKGDPADCEEVFVALQSHLERELQHVLACSGTVAFQAADIDRMVAFDPKHLPV